MNGERDPKRVRFENDAEAAAASEGETHVKLHAREVVEVRFVTSADEISDNGAVSLHKEEATFVPSYLHQVFPKEEVIGYTAAKLAVYADPLTLYTYLSSHTVMEQPARVQTTKLEDTVAPFIKGGLCATRDEFETRLAERDSHVPPVSNLVRRYRARNESFGVYKESMVDNESLAEFHKRIAFFMFVHIDGASFIDASDPRWELYLVHRLDKTGRPREFIAYATAYPFAAMCSSPEEGVGFVRRLSIAQVFVMPPSQGSGHGARLLEAIYEQAVAVNTLEVTVEDPSEGFRLLRDLTDLRRAYDSGILDYKKPFDYSAEHELSLALRTKLKITRGQARRCLEVHALVHVDTKNDAQFKKYRLWIKRRLHSEFLDVLEFYGPLEKKSKLAELYSDYEREYRIVVERLAKRGASLPDCNTTD